MQLDQYPELEAFFKHSRERLHERFEIDIDFIDYVELCFMCNSSRRYMFSKGRFICLITKWRDIVHLPVVYDPECKAVVTALTHSMFMGKLESFGHVTKTMSGIYYTSVNDYIPFIDSVNCGKVVV